VELELLIHFITLEIVILQSSFLLLIHLQ